MRIFMQICKRVYAHVSRAVVALDLIELAEHVGHDVVGSPLHATRGGVGECRQYKYFPFFSACFLLFVPMEIAESVLGCMHACLSMCIYV